MSVFIRAAKALEAWGKNGAKPHDLVELVQELRAAHIAQGGVLTPGLENPLQADPNVIDVTHRGDEIDAGRTATIPPQPQPQQDQNGKPGQKK